MDNREYQQVESDDNLLSFLDFRKLLSDVLRYWWLFVASVTVVLFGLKIYHRYKTPVYSSEATLIIDNSGKNNQSSDLLQGVVLGQNVRNFDNQLAILQSRTLTAEVVDNMGVFISYFKEGRVKTVELYGNMSFMVVMDSTHVQPLNTKITINPQNDNTISVRVEAENVELYNYHDRQVVGTMANIKFEGTYLYGQPIVTPWCAFSVVSQTPLDAQVHVVFNDPDRLIDRFSNSFSVRHDKKSESSVVTLSVVGTNSKRNRDFLNTLIRCYIKDNLHQKNEMSENTIRFIEGQLAMLQDTLSYVENELSRFRTQHGIQSDLSKKGTELLSEIKDYDDELKQLTLESIYYEYLESYLSNDSIMSGDIAPATFKTERPIIAKLLNEILELNAKKQVYRDTYGKEGNPMYDALTAELNIARNTLLTSIKSHKQMVQDNIRDVQGKLDFFTREASELPETERRLIGIDRKFTLNNDVYNFLMRKRAEAQIQRASNTADHKLLDPAMTMGIISPNVKRNQSLGIALALMIPLLLLVLRQVVDNRVRTDSDVKRLSPLPIVGEIPNSKKDTPFVVQEYPRSNMAEEFRRIRIKLDFIGKGAAPSIITVTSAMPGDGKTFCALNIASVFSIASKKTVLLGLDLRKPGLTRILGKQNQPGLTDCLIGNAKLEDVVTRYNNLDIVLSGTIPPNPSEIIMSKEFADLMERLKREYDVIVMDTPPVGLVSDAYQLAQQSSATVFVIRQDFTVKEVLKDTLRSIKENGITNTALIMNDINNTKTRYGYGYGYGNYGRYGKYARYGRYGYGVDKPYGGYAED